MSLIAKQLADSIALLSHEKRVGAEIAAAEAASTQYQKETHGPASLRDSYYPYLSGALRMICSRLARELDAKDREIEELKRREGEDNG